LYLHGLADEDFDLALRGLLGEKAPLSVSTVARLKEKWQAVYNGWGSQELKGLQVVYLWADELYVKAGLEMFSQALKQHIRTTNVVESAFAAMRLRAGAAKRFKKGKSATEVIWKMMLVAEKRFRKLNAPELLQEVYWGVEYVDGVAIGKTKEAAA
jgi:hypothetical protein